MFGTVGENEKFMVCVKINQFLIDLPLFQKLLPALIDKDSLDEIFPE